ncbi:MAG: DUF975 family protein [Clostridiales bacterium]|nr:DUF975 family protein [Clostridiales bacterium]
MVSCKEIKRVSRENLNRRYSIPIIAYALSTALASLVELPFSSLIDEYATMTQTVTYYIAEFMISVLSCVLIFGECKIHLNMAREKEYAVSHLFYCFRDDLLHYLAPALLLTILSTIAALPLNLGLQNFLVQLDLKAALILLGLALLTLVLTLIIQVQFGLLYFVIMDHPVMSLRDSLITTFGLIKGCRGKYLHLIISFIGMAALAYVSLGLGWLWVHPYMLQAEANFYRDLCGELSPNRDNSSEYTP